MRHALASTAAVGAREPSREPGSWSEQRVDAPHADGEAERVGHRHRDQRLRGKLLLLLLALLRLRLLSERVVLLLLGQGRMHSPLGGCGLGRVERVRWAGKLGGREVR